MSTPTVAALTLMRERMSDPRRVVLDPRHTREFSDGTSCSVRRSVRWAGEPQRACLLGWAMFFDSEGDTGEFIVTACSDLGVSCADESWYGRQIDVIDRAVELATAQETRA